MKEWNRFITSHIAIFDAKVYFHLYGIFNKESVYIMQKMSERKWDKYCWHCHKPSNVDVKCTKCILSFHTSCMPDVNRKKAGWMCPECKLETHEEGYNLG